jgi:predicted DNA-binding protein (MmcQ/YjbR family)
MDIEWVRKYCLSLPHTTEQVQWGNDLVFKIGGKMYAVVDLEPDDSWLGFKCTPSEFAELIERPAIRPAPYLARAQWVVLESEDALPRNEIKRLLKVAYNLVYAKLTKKVRGELESIQRGGGKKAAGIK